MAWASTREISRSSSAADTAPTRRAASPAKASAFCRVSAVRAAALPLINAAAGFANAAAIDAISLLPGVAFVHHDLTVGPRHTAAPPPLPPGPPSTDYARVVKARQVWQDGITGSGVAGGGAGLG